MEQIKEESLAFSQSPLCPIAADVISDGESIYFYMYDLDYEQQRLIARSACWVKNLKAAPVRLIRMRLLRIISLCCQSNFCRIQQIFYLGMKTILKLFGAKKGISQLYIIKKSSTALSQAGLMEKVLAGILVI